MGRREGCLRKSVPISTGWLCDPLLLRLLYREVANLHSFPPAPAFTFPASVTRRQRYRLLGNSLSVEVVADLLRYLLGAPRSAAEGGAQRTSLEQAAAASAKAAAAVAALGGSDTVVGHATARQGQVQQQQHL
jgi:hypothetical protein